MIHKLPNYSVVTEPGFKPGSLSREPDSQPLPCAISPCVVYEHRKFVIVLVKVLLVTFIIIYNDKILFTYCNTHHVEYLGR